MGAGLQTEKQCKGPTWMQQELSRATPSDTGPGAGVLLAW